VVALPPCVAGVNSRNSTSPSAGLLRDSLGGLAGGFILQRGWRFDDHERRLPWRTGFNGAAKLAACVCAQCAYWTYAPSGNSGAVDFGTIIESADGGRAIDVPGSLGAMNGFTVCGWVNCRDLSIGWGGNRIVFALDAENGRGFDLVHLADGSLRLGVNQNGPMMASADLSAHPARLRGS